MQNWLNGLNIWSSLRILKCSLREEPLCSLNRGKFAVFSYMQRCHRGFRSSWVQLCCWVCGPQNFEGHIRLHLNGPSIFEDEGDASSETSVNSYSSTQLHALKAVNLRKTSSCGYIRNVTLFPVVFRKCLSFSLLLYLTLSFFSSRRRDAHSVVHWTPKNEDVLLPVLGSTPEECKSASISPCPARWVTAVCRTAVCCTAVCYTSVCCTAVCYTVMCRSGSIRGPKARSVRPTQEIPHLLWHLRVRCLVYMTASHLQLHPISVMLAEKCKKQE
jgi:hypothetical protein